MKEKNNISRDLLQFIKIVNKLISSENNEPVFKDPENYHRLSTSVLNAQLMIRSFIKSLESYKET